MFLWNWWCGACHRHFPKAGTITSIALHFNQRLNPTNGFCVRSRKNQGAFISFESPELLFKVISGKRWDLLKIMTGAGPMTIREAARRLERDVKAVHGDVQALLKAGILQKNDNGQIVFPYDVMHVDFKLKAV